MSNWIGFAETLRELKRIINSPEINSDIKEIKNDVAISKRVKREPIRRSMMKKNVTRERMLNGDRKPLNNKPSHGISRKGRLFHIPQILEEEEEDEDENKPESDKVPKLTTPSLLKAQGIGISATKLFKSNVMESLNRNSRHVGQILEEEEEDEDDNRPESEKIPKLFFLTNNMLEDYEDENKDENKPESDKVPKLTTPSMLKTQSIEISATKLLKNNVLESLNRNSRDVGQDGYLPEDGFDIDPLTMFELKEREMKEQNQLRKKFLQKALADRTKKTQEEAKRLNQIEEELKKLDATFSNDVNIIRNQIEVASHDYMVARKRYDKAEHDFLEAKHCVIKHKERKELLTSHLCMIIEQNELRKAKKLSDLVEKLQLGVKNSGNTKTKVSFESQPQQQVAAPVDKKENQNIKSP